MTERRGPRRQQGRRHDHDPLPEGSTGQRTVEFADGAWRVPRGVIGVWFGIGTEVARIAIPTDPAEQAELWEWLDSRPLERALLQVACLASRDPALTSVFVDGEMPSWMAALLDHLEFGEVEQ